MALSSSVMILQALQFIVSCLLASLDQPCESLRAYQCGKAALLHCNSQGIPPLEEWHHSGSGHPHHGHWSSAYVPHEGHNPEWTKARRAWTNNESLCEQLHGAISRGKGQVLVKTRKGRGRSEMGDCLSTGYSCAVCASWKVHIGGEFNLTYSIVADELWETDEWSRHLIEAQPLVDILVCDNGLLREVRLK